MHRRPMGIPGMAALVLLAACSPGGTAPSGDFTVAAGPAAPATLGTTDTFDVTVTSAGGFAGSVLLTFGGVPTDWVVTLSQNPVVVPANGSGMSTVSITVPTNGTPAPSGQAVTVQATGLARYHTAPVTVTVANEFFAAFTLGTDTLTHFGALAGATLHFNVGTTITVRNDDTTAHRVHYDGTIGLMHEAADLPTGQSYSQVIGGTGTDHLLCLDHPDAGTITLVVP